jgi:hypothetical protein
MNEIANRTGGATGDPRDHRLEHRFVRVMITSVALATIVSVAMAPWRVTTGLLLGGLLSLLNFRWMRVSIAALIEARIAGRSAAGKMLLYLLRYFVLAATVTIAYNFNVISLPATIAGLCSFVVAIFSEALRQVYLVIIHREEVS